MLGRAMLGLLAAVAPLAAALACTRALYAHGGLVITGRTMDWKLPMRTNLWAFPRGQARDGAAGPSSVKWVSRYGSVMASGEEVSTSDGMNERGLVVNAQWLTPSTYPKLDGKRPAMSIAIWAQFFLDQFATVDEAVAYLAANPFDVVSGEVPGQPGRVAAMHLALSDATGDSAILSWIDGKLRVDHSRDYKVMTNEPPFPEQLAITEYWRQVGGRAFLPGTARAADRFARASFYIDNVVKTTDRRAATAAVFSVMRNASVPYGFNTSDAPNLSTTRWRTVSDQTHRIYYFESALSPNVFWVDLAKLNFAPGQPVRKLDLGADQTNIYSGETSAKFVAAPGGFRWLAAD